MRLNEFISDYDLINCRLHIGSMFGDTLNLIDADDSNVLRLDLNYEILKKYMDEDVGTVVEISNKDYQDLLKRMSNK